MKLGDGGTWKQTGPTIFDPLPRFKITQTFGGKGHFWTSFPHFANFPYQIGQKLLPPPTCLWLKNCLAREIHPGQFLLEIKENTNKQGCGSGWSLPVSDLQEKKKSGSNLKKTTESDRISVQVRNPANRNPDPHQDPRNFLPEIKFFWYSLFQGRWFSSTECPHAGKYSQPNIGQCYFYPFHLVAPKKDAWN